MNSYAAAQNGMRQEHDPIDWNQIDLSIMLYFNDLEHRTLIKPESV